MKKRGTGNYLIFDRLIYLMNVEEFKLSYYMNKFEITRSTAFRDINHLKLFHDIEFVYDLNKKLYVKTTGGEK